MAAALSEKRSRIGIRKTDFIGKDFTNLDGTNLGENIIRIIKGFHGLLKRLHGLKWITRIGAGRDKL